MEKPQIKAVIIDLDDTLCLTEAACFAMENEILVSMGQDPMPRELHLNTWGKPLFDIIATRSPGVNVEKFKSAFDPMMVHYIETGKLDAIPPENYEALDKLAALGKTSMILTSREHVELRHLLEPDHNLASKIKTFYYKDNTKYHKPDPRVFNELLRDNNFKPNECAYVGDSISDAQATKEAGLHFIANLESGIKQVSDFSEFAVDIFINKFPEVVDAVTTLENRLAA